MLHEPVTVPILGALPPALEAARNWVGITGCASTVRGERL